MKVYLAQNVWDAALDRISWLFDEFPEVIACISGGKDSTVILNLCLQVAKEKGRLPLSVFFIDQEAEWATVIDYIRAVMNRPDVNPIWLQVPLRLFNATSNTNQWLYCWEPGAQWMREKEPNSIHENTFGTDRFAEMFGAWLKTERKGQSVAQVSGVRCEESPTRMNGMTHGNVYKGRTWGKVWNRKHGHFAFYPIYDWSYTDVWKAIHDNAWDYCSIYDVMYQYGVPATKMRVSNVHHETAVWDLEYLQEMDPETWSALTERLSGCNAVGQMQGQWFIPEELPWMFNDWKEYRDHLCENMLTDPQARAKMRALFERGERTIADQYHEAMYKVQIAMVLVNDLEGTKWASWSVAHLNWHRARNPQTSPSIR